MVEETIYLIDLIKFLIQQQRTSFAKVLLKKLVLQYPTQSKYYEYLIIIATLNHNRDEYLVWHKIILEKFPGTALDMMARALFPGEKISNVKAYLKTAIKLEPQNPNLYYFLSSIYLYNGNYKISLRYANRCLKLDPTFFLAFFLRIGCYRPMGMQEELLKDTSSVKFYIQRFKS